MKFVLIRHSKTEPTADIPIPQWGLTEEGQERTKKLAENPEIKQIEVMYSSLQTKALETALILAKPNAIPIKTDDRLTESTSITNKFFGPDEYEENAQNYFTGKVKSLAGGETIKQVLERLNKAIDEICTSEKDKETIGIVSHGGALSLFSSQYSNKTPLEIHHVIQMPDFAILDYSTKKFHKFFSDNNDN